MMIIFLIASVCVRLLNIFSFYVWVFILIISRSGFSINVTDSGWRSDKKNIKTISPAHACIPSFEARKFAILGPCLISLILLPCSAHYFFNISLFIVHLKHVQLHFFGIYDFLTECKLTIKVLTFGLRFTHFRVLGVHLGLSCIKWQIDLWAVC